MAGKNGFIIPEADTTWPEGQQDEWDADHMLRILEDDIVEYTMITQTKIWVEMNYQSMEDVDKYFRQENGR